MNPTSQNSAVKPAASYPQSSREKTRGDPTYHEATRNDLQPSPNYREQLGEGDFKPDRWYSATEVLEQSTLSLEEVVDALRKKEINVRMTRTDGGRTALFEGQSLNRYIRNLGDRASASSDPKDLYEDAPAETYESDAHEVATDAKELSATASHSKRQRSERADDDEFDSVRILLNYARQIPLLTAAQEVEYATIIQANKQEAQKARERLEYAQTNQERQELQDTITQAERIAKEYILKGTEANYRLVIVCAADQYHRLREHYPTTHLSLSDLVQEGVIGLQTALEKFDPHFRKPGEENRQESYRLSTYAGHWINQAIARAIKNKELPMRVPVASQADWKEANHIRTALKKELGRQPTLEEIAERSSKIDPTTGKKHPVTLETLVSVERALNIYSLDRPLQGTHSSDKETTLQDIIPASSQTPEEIGIEKIFNEEVRDLLANSGLKERERDVVKMRCGIDYDRPHTLEEIGNTYSLTRERIRKIEERALEKLRKNAEQRGWQLSR